MRMFLVVMCDMFLLLYLTALAQIEAHPVSDLTVKDYIALKRAEEDTRRTAEQRKVELQARDRDAGAAAERIAALEKQLQALSERTRKLDSAVDEAKAEQTKSEREREEIRKKWEAEQARLREEQQRAELQRQESEAAIAAKAAEKVEAERRAEETRRQAEEFQKKAEEAERLAAEAKEAAELSRRAAEAASTEKAQALELARSAQSRELDAVLSAHRSAAAAEEARQLADRSTEAARRAEKERARVSERLRSTTQQAETAFQKNVSGRIVPVRSRVETKNLLIGRTDRQLQLATLSVSLSGKKVVFLPLSQIGIERDRDAEDYTRVDFSTDGSPVKQLLVNKDVPELVGLVLDPGVPAAAAVPGSVSLGGFMPTLIAIRNGAEMNFRDRIRGIDTERFIFQRDRLRALPDGRLRYEASGFRGTGDFGQRLVEGDIVVDLDGSFIGVATDDGTIRRISSLEGWQEISLSGRSARDIMSEVRRVVR